MFCPQRTLSERAPFTPRHSTTAPPVAQQPNQPLYIVVFGYPVDKFSLTVEYFKAIGDATDPEESTELVNCFRIGYRDPGDALRAVRKNGEVISGTFMIGAKWAVSTNPPCPHPEYVLIFRFSKPRIRHRQKPFSAYSPSSAHNSRPRRPCPRTWPPPQTPKMPWQSTNRIPSRPLIPPLALAPHPTTPTITAHQRQLAHRSSWRLLELLSAKSLLYPPAQNLLRLSMGPCGAQG